MDFCRSLARPLLLLFLLSTPLAAQASREELISSEQARKAQALAPEQPSRLERLLGRFALNPDPEGVYPWFGSVFPGGGLALGAAYQQHLPRGARAGAAVGWSIRDYKLLEGRVGVPLRRDGSLHVGIVGRWIDAPSVAFYGLGPDSPAAGRVTFDHEPSRVTLRLSAQPRRVFSLGGEYELMSAPTSGGLAASGLLHPERAPGFGQNLQFNVFRGVASVDTRSSPGYSDTGGLYRVAWARHDERRGRPFSFDETEVELAQLIPLVGKYVVLGVRALGTFTDPAQGDEVPFVLAPSLGSGSTLRGFHNRRFQDRHRVLLTGEYRWQASRFLNMAVFLDAGQVGPEADRFRWHAFETSWGVGARFHGPSSTPVRLELARSREGWIIVAGASQPF